MEKEQPRKDGPVEKGEGAVPATGAKDAQKAEKKEAKGGSALEGIDSKHPMNDYIASRLLQRFTDATSKEQAEKIAKNVMLDLYYGCYLPVPSVKEDAEETQRKLMEMMLSMPNIDEVRLQSTANAAVSSAAAIEFANTLIKELEKMAKSNDQEKAQNAQKILDGIKGEGGEGQQGEGKEGKDKQGQQGQGQQQNQQGKDGQGGQQPQQGQGQQQGQNGSGNGVEEVMRQAMEKAMGKAQERANDVKKLQNTINKAEGGKNAGPGSSYESGADIDKILELSRRMNIMLVLKLLEGMPQLVLKASKKYKEDKSGENLEYERGGEIARLVPTELGLPDAIFYSKFSQNDLLLYKKGREKEPGYIYVLVDKSSSMDMNAKSPWSKAVALALYLKARGDGRDFYMRFFDDSPHGLMEVKKGVRGKSIAAVEYIAGTKPTGGTSISAALEQACEDMAKRVAKEHSKEKSTIVLITDGEDSIDVEAMRKRLDAANAILIAVIVQGNNDDLRRLAKQYLMVQALSDKDAFAVVKAG